VFVSGRYAYVAAVAADRLTVVDVSDPAAPTVKGSFSDATNLDGVESVFVSGRYAYVAASNVDRVTIIDISDPSTPAFVGSVQDNTVLNGVNSIFVSGRYAYVTGIGAFTVVDVADPTAPSIAGSVTDGTILNGASSVFVSGRYAYVASSAADRLTVVDVSNPLAPAIKGSLQDATNLDGVDNVFVSGRYAYLTSAAADRFSILELDTLEAPTVEAGVLQVGSLEVSDYALFNNGVNVRGGLNVSDTGAMINGDLVVGGAFNLGEKLRVLGDVKVGTGTTGCVKDADNTTLTGTCVSDARLKKDIAAFNPVLVSLSRLQPVRFTWRGDEYPQLGVGTARSFGLIADEAELLFPELVSTNEQGYKVVHYHLLPFLLLQGIRELHAENDALRAEVAALRETDNRHPVAYAVPGTEDAQPEIGALRERLTAAEQHNASLEARLRTLEARSEGTNAQEGRVSTALLLIALAGLLVAGVAAAIVLRASRDVRQKQPR
jgi:hypothetical protein